MTDIFTFTLDDETEKKLFELLTDVDVSKTPSFSIKDKHGGEAEYVKVVRCKDCKFATITAGVYGKEPEVKYCDIWFPREAEYMPINYYCASAERKEE